MGAPKNDGKKRRRKGVKQNLSKKRKGKGLLNKIIDKIPFEMHVPGYQYCGPGTHLEKRLKRGDPGKNPLDVACKAHDIAYNEHKDSIERAEADKILQKVAMKRVFSKDATIGERTTALGVAMAMKVKRTLSGKGLSKKPSKIKKKKRKKVSFTYLIKKAKVAIKKSKPENIDSAIKVAVASIKKTKKGKYIKEPRTIKLPNTTTSGGMLPLVPIFAGLSALGSIIGSSASIANAINQAKKGQTELAESKRHNGMMEAIAIGAKSGKGFYLHANKSGKGYYLTTHSKNC